MLAEATVPIELVRNSEQLGRRRQITLGSRYYLQQYRTTPVAADYTVRCSSQYNKHNSKSPEVSILFMFKPDYAYIPGTNQRHAENTFEEICATAKLGASVKELGQCDAFKHGLMYLHEGFYWESHEVFESVWMALPAESCERRYVQGLIQLANASLKNAMGKPKAVRRLCVLARELLSNNNENQLPVPDLPVFLQRIDALEQLSKD